LPEPVQTMILKKQLTAAHGHELLRLAPFPEICLAVANKCITDKITAGALSVHPMPGALALKRAKSVVELGSHTKFEWRKVCRECPFKAFVTSNFATYCLKPTEYRKKQDHAIELQKQEATRILEAAGKQEDGEVDIKSMPAGSYRDLSMFPIPTGCSGQCPCRKEYTDPNDPTRARPVCVDLTRLKLLADQDREAQEEAARRRYDTMFDSAMVVLFGGAQDPGASEPVPGPALNLAESDGQAIETKCREVTFDAVAVGTSTDADEEEDPAVTGDTGASLPAKLDSARALAVVAAHVFQSVRYPVPGIWERVVEAVGGLCRTELTPEILTTFEALLYDDVETEQALDLLAAQDPDTVLVLTAGLLLMEEIDNCLRYREAPARLQFVLSTRQPNQSTMEVMTDEEEAGAEPEAAIDDHGDCGVEEFAEEDGMTNQEESGGEEDFAEPSEDYPGADMGGAPSHPQERWGYPDLEIAAEEPDEGSEFPDDLVFAEDQHE